MRQEHSSRRGGRPRAPRQEHDGAGGFCTFSSIVGMKGRNPAPSAGVDKDHAMNPSLKEIDQALRAAPDTFPLMTTAADSGKASAPALAAILLQRWGGAIFSDRNKQLVGRVVRKLMIEAGYVTDRRLRVYDGRFSMAMRYRKAPA